ncbi:MAG: hypothetical protein R2738_00720 [Bacteroides graminisolvens]
MKGFDANLNAALGYGFMLGGGYSFAYARGKDESGWTNIERSIRHTGSVTANWAHSWKAYQLNVNFNGRTEQRFHQSGDLDESAPGLVFWNLNSAPHF